MNTNLRPETTDNYVYVYLDPTKPGKYTYENLPMSFLYEPFYVGKGRQKRMYNHIAESKSRERKSQKHKRILHLLALNEPIRDYIIKIKDNMKEEEAYALEVEAIYQIGREVINTGPLLNVNHGGLGAPRGVGSKLSYKDELDAVKFYKENEVPVAEVARRYTVADTTMLLIFSKHAVEIKPSSNFTTKIKGSRLTSLVEDYNSGATLTDLAAKYDVCPETIANTLKANNVPSRGAIMRSTALEFYSEENAKEIIRMYVEEGISTRNIGSMYGISFSTVLSILRKNDVYIRTPKDKGQPPEVKELVIKLRKEEGMTFEQIGNIIGRCEWSARNIWNQYIESLNQT